MRFPEDEEKKNAICTPMNAPQLPAEWFKLSHIANINGDKIGKALGLSWIRKKRLSPLHHAPLIPFLKAMAFMIRNKDQINEKLKLFGEQEELYGKCDK